MIGQVLRRSGRQIAVVGVVVPIAGFLAQLSTPPAYPVGYTVAIAGFTVTIIGTILWLVGRAGQRTGPTDRLSGYSRRRAAARAPTSSEGFSGSSRLCYPSLPVLRSAELARPLVLPRLREAASTAHVTSVEVERRQSTKGRFSFGVYGLPIDSVYRSHCQHPILPASFLMLRAANGSLPGRLSTRGPSVLFRVGW